MDVQATARDQYRRIVEAASKRVPPTRPKEGWLRTVRKALGMSGTQLAKRLGVTKGHVAHVEKRELSGALTLKTLETAAEAMGCRFVYSIVPKGGVDDAIMSQARKKAAALVGTASKHMALEDQLLPEKRIAEKIERTAQDLARQLPKDFWND